MAKSGKILETREYGKEESEEEDQEKEVASVIFMSRPRSKESRSTKRKRKTEEGCPSTEVMSDENLNLRCFWRARGLQLT